MCGKGLVNITYKMSPGFLTNKTLSLRLKLKLDKSMLIEFQNKRRIAQWEAMTITRTNKGGFRSRPISAFVYVLALSQSECVNREFCKYTKVVTYE